MFDTIFDASTVPRGVLLATCVGCFLAGFCRGVRGEGAPKGSSCNILACSSGVILCTLFAASEGQLDFNELVAMASSVESLSGVLHHLDVLESCMTDAADGGL